MEKCKIFISYSHEDTELFRELKKGIESYSKNSKNIIWDIWTDVEIPVGELWHEAIQETVQSSSAAMLFVSQHFFGSNYIKNEEFLKFVEKHKKENFTFFPVLLSDCDYTQWEDLVKIQFFNPKGQDYNVVKFKNNIVPYDYIDRPHLKNTYYKECVEAFEKAILHCPQKSDVVKLPNIPETTFPKVQNNCKKIRSSGYDPKGEEEFQRLKIQSDISKKSDEDAIKIAFKDLKKVKNLNVLDVGCAYGFVGYTRFSDERFSNIVGIDKNLDCINYAKEKFGNDRFSYYQVDLTSDFSIDVDKIKQEKMIDSFDIVFIAYVLHHLGDDIVFKVLRILRKHMSSNGVIIIRSVDDGSKLAYNDDGLLEKIFVLGRKAHGRADRINGRKLFGYLFNTGFRDIKIISNMKDTTCFDIDDQRPLLFKASFSFRTNALERNLKNDPNNRELQENLNEMKELLEEFETMFHKKDFWYCEYDYVGIAKK